MGKELVKDLKLEKRGDTLSTWMAYYISEQIAHAQTSSKAQKAAAEQKCFETILALWKHRAFLPSGHRPFESFEPIFRALARLDPQKTPVFYDFQDWGNNPKANRPNDVVSRLIEYAFQTDSVARTLIREALDQAACAANSKKAKHFLRHALPTTLNDDDIKVIVKIAGPNEQKLTKKERQDAQRNDLKNKIAQMRGFSEISSKVVEFFEAKLEKLK